ncbi:hypothetical protein IAD21_05813 [Abditibacteriota bacterium]|nr:hypothetical protein IAD21_05813 [Abditibacteriota bacterium]
MQPDPFASNSQAQPFSESAPQPIQHAPIAPPVGSAPASPPSISAGDYVPPIGPQDPASLEANEGLAALVKTHSRGANWFFWIVGLSLVNAFLISGGSDKVMAIGANATLIMDYIAKEEIAKSASMAGTLRGVEVIFDVLVLGFYAFCGLMAVRGRVWGFYVGMTVFALDTIVSVISVDVIGGLLHAWALFCMWQGVSALKQIHALRQAAQAPVSPWAA